jgi:lipopolysaccharide/colanic/teichoic acid biosynthesis glycosyltransferase
VGRTNSYAILKRVLDVCTVIVALPLAVPIILLAIVAIRIDSPGAPLFSQFRTGKNGRRFKMYKLRTMSRDAESLKERFHHLNELQWPDFKISNDPRITRVGGFLRRTSIDELPQIFNVLIGDMSLIGPRPTSFRIERYHMWHTARLNGKPGLTGLWQVSGRNELEFDDRVRLDVAYLRNESLSLDFRILLRTFGAVLSGRGAN